MTELLPSLETILQSIAAGLLVGFTYGLMCVALGLIFGVMRLINFAQGDFLMLGMYFALSIVTIFGFGSLIGPISAVVVAAIASVPVFLRRRIHPSLGHVGPYRRRPEFDRG